MDSDRKATKTLPYLGNTAFACLLVGLISLLINLGYTYFQGPPHPFVGDEFSYLLAGETFAQGRLTNPAHPHWEFFETVHVIQQPSYMSKYLPLKGFFLAIGVWCGAPIVGIWLSVALMAAAFCWAIRGFLGPLWALGGGLLCAIQFSGYHYWSYSYWGGAEIALSGACVLGGVVRLREQLSIKSACIMGLGVIGLLFSRPFEGGFFCLVLAVYFVWLWLKKYGITDMSFCRKALLPALAMVVLGCVFLLYYNYRVTGAASMFPYKVYESSYSAAPLFVWEEARPAPDFRHQHMKRFDEEFSIPGARFDVPMINTYVRRVQFILTEYLLLPLLGLFGFAWILCWRDVVFRLVAAVLCCQSLAFLLSYWMSIHYVAPALIACYAVSLIAMQRVTELIARHAQLRAKIFILFIIAGCCAHWGIRYQRHKPFVEGLEFHEQRSGVIQALVSAGKPAVVFVKYLADYDPTRHWVYNTPDIDDAFIVWANDMGCKKNKTLRAYYAPRAAFTLELSKEHINLKPYVCEDSVD